MSPTEPERIVLEFFYERSGGMKLWKQSEPKRDAAGAIDALIAQVSSPVRWEAVVRRLASEGVTTYVEVGPGTVLSGLVKKIHRDATIVNFGSPEDLAAVEGLASA